MKRIIIIIILIVFGSLINVPGSIENSESNAHGFDTSRITKADNTTASSEEDKLVLYLEEVQEPMAGSGIEHLFSSNNTTESSDAQHTEKNSNTEKNDTQQKPIKVRTKI